jgi:hypothetical protein
MAILSILVYLAAIWYILWLFGIFFGFLYHEKSGNPESRLLFFFSVMLMPDDFRAFSKIKIDNHAFNKENLPSHFKVNEILTQYYYPRYGANLTTFELTATMPAL